MLFFPDGLPCQVAPKHKWLKMLNRNTFVPSPASFVSLLGLRSSLLEYSLLTLLLYLVATKEVSITLVLNEEILGTVGSPSFGSARPPVPQPFREAGNPPSRATALTGSPAPTPTVSEPDFHDVAQTDDPAPHISNLTLVLSPDYARRKQLPDGIVRAKRQRVQGYIDRYREAAQAEMRQYGIPASITLAQGLLESNAGDSKLARESNNHFGIKCRSKCRGCTCRNYSDDSHYDMFRVFENAQDSFREHSELLQLSRYRKLKTYGKDFRKWAHGLKSAGYATDKRYAEKLIKIIETLDLARYDEPGNV